MHICQQVYVDLQSSPVKSIRMYNAESRVHHFSTAFKMPVEFQTVCVKSEVLIVVRTGLMECDVCSAVGGTSNGDKQEAPGDEGSCLKIW
jgi:hypothetical protein